MKISKCSHRPILEACGLKNFDHQIDPYVGCAHHCHYCYALNQAETDWTREIQIHEDIGRQLRDELEPIAPQKIYMGYCTDPYQPCEAEVRQTRAVLELLLEKGFSASILTKSDLVLRDLDLLQAMDDASVSVSVAFDDNSTRARFEANTKDTATRIDALHRLSAAGIKTSALICPVVPYVTDVKPLIDDLAPVANTIWIYGLSIQAPTDISWRNTAAILKSDYPDVRKQIEEIVFSKEHPFWIELRQELEAIQEDRQLNLSIHV